MNYHYGKMSYKLRGTLFCFVPHTHTRIPCNWLEFIIETVLDTTNSRLHSDTGMEITIGWKPVRYGIEPTIEWHHADLGGTALEI